MDTKWKNRAMPILAVLLLTFGLNALVTGLPQAREYTQKSYFYTEQFEGELSEYIRLLSMFELEYTSKEEAKEALTATKEEIEEHRYRYGDLNAQIENIQAQYEERIQEAKDTGNEEVAKLYTAERDTKIEDITNNFKDDQYVRQKVINEKAAQLDEYYAQLEQERSRLAHYSDVFLYYLEDTVTGKVYTNNEALQSSSYEDMLFTLTYPAENGGYLTPQAYISGMSPFFTTNHYFKGTIAIPKSANQAGPIIQHSKTYESKKTMFLIYMICGLAAFLIAIYVLKQFRIGQIPEQWKHFYSRIPIDVRLAVFLFTLFITLVWVMNDQLVYMNMNMYRSLSDILFTFLWMSTFVAASIIQGKLLLEERADGGLTVEKWQSAFACRIWRRMKEVFLIRSVGVQVMIVLGIVFMLGFGIIFVAYERSLILFIFLYAPALVFIGVPTVLLITKHIGYFNKIVSSTNELAAGTLRQDIPVKGKTVLAGLARNINMLKSNVASSQKEQAKSERLKTELITNVSHDLRTPLTSIIAYTELLKAPELADEDRQAYVEIIDRKSKRLKGLIDDLFEASKMASGSTQLEKEKIDIIQLLQQALAEYDAMIGESTLQFRVITPDSPLYTVVDGPKMWRVFENIIGNILKYSLEHTRVYITADKSDGSVRIIFKNVSKYELGGSTDELFERFKRGDTSRHTEGSGLGLAIAKSIVDLHEGDLQIELDGDLFKVTVLLDAVE